MSPQEILDAIQADQDKATEKAKRAIVLVRRDLELRKDMDAMAIDVENGIRDSIELIKRLGWKEFPNAKGMWTKVDRLGKTTFVVPPHQVFELERAWAHDALAQIQAVDSAEKARKAGDN